MAPANLLTIPRELRDIIYAYLYQPAQLQWSWDGTEQKCTIHVHLRHAPLLNMLLAHPQIHAEYQDLIAEPLCATVEWYHPHRVSGWSNPVVSKWSTGQDPATLPNVPAIVLTQLRRATILIPRPSGLLNPYVWKRAVKFATALKEAAPRMKTMCIQLKDQCKKPAWGFYLADDDLRPDKISKLSTKSMRRLFQQQPKSIAGMSLVFNGHGIFAECSVTRCRYLRLQKQRPIDYVVHLLHFAGMYVYTSDTQDANLMEAKQFFDYWCYQKYPGSLERYFGGEVASRIRGREQRMLEWQEQHFQESSLKRKRDDV